MRVIHAYRNYEIEVLLKRMQVSAEDGCDGPFEESCPESSPDTLEQWCDKCLLMVANSALKQAEAREKAYLEQLSTLRQHITRTNARLNDLLDELSRPLN